MSCGFIRIVGEDFPNKSKVSPEIGKEPLTLEDELDFCPGKCAINPPERIDYQIILYGFRKKIVLHHGHAYRVALNKFNAIVRQIKLNKSLVTAKFWSNDYMVEKYERTD